MAFRVIVLPLAFEDIDETTLFIAAGGNPERAGRWREGAFDATEDLAETPTRHPKVPEAEALGIDVRQCHYHSHRIIFRIVGETVEVLRVYHGSRRALGSADLPE